MYLSIFGTISDVLSYLVDGTLKLVNFLFELPNLINSLLDIIPNPFKQIILAFSGIIILFFIVKAVRSIVS